MKQAKFSDRCAINPTRYSNILKRNLPDSKKGRGSSHPLATVGRRRKYVLADGPSESPRMELEWNERRAQE
ncbi:hypothetical protein A0H81_13582 [Grifola frondosa]|uniref:Uncharacterized protein n=1 Tax=Grifola frondosa TaxID=5627 RepID=A0A1C7LU61_GRIFR|nr:hypothetical protein A0H81_13582 [Grifola frondosa]